MTDFVEIIKKDSKVQDDISRTNRSYNKKSFAAQSKVGKNDLIQSKVFEQAIQTMGEIIGDMDIDLEQKDIKISFLENKIGTTDDKVVEKKINRIWVNYQLKKLVKEFCIE